jgi:hypothetical protein
MMFYLEILTWAMVIQTASHVYFSVISMRQSRDLFEKSQNIKEREDNMVALWERIKEKTVDAEL